MAVLNITGDKRFNAVDITLIVFIVCATLASLLLSVAYAIESKHIEYIRSHRVLRFAIILVTFLTNMDHWRVRHSAILTPMIVSMCVFFALEAFVWNQNSVPSPGTVKSGEAR